MLTRLSLKNFKSWRETGDINLSRVTGFFGTNSSGKTSLLQSLLLLKQTKEGTDRRAPLRTGDDTSYVDLGVFSDMLFGHANNQGLELDLSWQVGKSKYAFGFGEKPAFPINLSFATHVKEIDGVPTTSNFLYKLGEKSIGMTRLENGKEGHYDIIASGYEKVRAVGRKWPVPNPIKCYGFPDEVRTYFQRMDFVQDYAYELEQQLSRLYYLGPLREYPKRNYVWGGDIPEDVGRRGENSIAAILASRKWEDYIRRGKGTKAMSLEERIATWLQELGMIHSFRLHQLSDDKKQYQVRVKRAANSHEVLITDVGFGVSQILPVLTLCYYVPSESTILLEQPEIHLHPAVQQGLADVLIDAAQTRKIQIIVESHSEHFLRRLQRRVAEKMIPQKDVRLYFCQHAESESKIEALDIDLLGNITNWPRGFFGDSAGDIIAMTEAQIKAQRT
ncbi:DUF3696 domain-containing protein [bacterium]|nr:DUF3696 domain-containing protein [bacterium]